MSKKAVIGQFYKTPERALDRANELKKLWKGRVSFVVIGNKKQWMVISESSARACGIKVPLTKPSR